MSEIKHPIQEAERYLQNVQHILSEKAEKDGDYYNDRKYVKMARPLLGAYKSLHKTLGYDVTKLYRTAWNRVK